jgi:hypothetical protein
MPSLSDIPSPNAEAVQKFKKLYFEVFGEELTDAKAYELARATMTLVYIAISPPPLPQESIDSTEDML